MTALTYQKDARVYRFSLPNEIWGLKLPPPAFSILAYLCYLNSHHKGEAMPSVDEIAALFHMSPDMAEKQLDTLVKRNLISPQMVPVFSRKHTGKFFSLPNEIFSLDLGHGACQSGSGAGREEPHQLHTIAGNVSYCLLPVQRRHCLKRLRLHLQNYQYRNRCAATQRNVPLRCASAKNDYLLSRDGG